ncbi:lipase [Lysinibacillus sphaericus]|uniref:Lipase n=3 Tax=Lysinibacillus TaxID=400634 RepID=W7S2E8_LYSSH|nr:probable lipase [Lysinibacillus sphaericus C3-41]AMO35180.1 lipase [Lysinibacillus sphaericus]EWH32381.1 lipase [Lysinibacillus sphaericus CBAM5]AMR92910.1 lipase [Lysinibacillus sphaericus]ANA48175.1 lipase [Lysinibacillus sphaericus]
MIPVYIIVIPILLIFIIGQFTPVLNTFIIKQLFESDSFASPKDIETIKRQVHVEKDIVYDEHGIENSLLDIYYPKNMKEELPVIMWIHGGAFVSGSKEQTQEYGMALANEGYVVANINYAIAPVQKYPGPIIQTNQALKYLQDNISKYGGNMNHLFIGGDSAGAQIASQTIAIITNEALAKSMDIQPTVDKKQLKGALLFCGVYNMDKIGAQSSPIIKKGIQSVFWAYTGTKDFKSYSRIDEMSTVKHVTPNYPPTFLTVGDADPLAPQSTELIDVLKKNGVEVESVLFEGTNSDLGHEYQFDFTTTHAEQTLGKTLAFIKKYSGK